MSAVWSVSFSCPRILLLFGLPGLFSQCLVFLFRQVFLLFLLILANSSFRNSFSVNHDDVSSSFRNYLILCLARLLLELPVNPSRTRGKYSLSTNTFCICFPLGDHILLSGNFWCLLRDLELPQVVPLFLLSDCLTTICWW